MKISNYLRAKSSKYTDTAGVNVIILFQEVPEPIVPAPAENVGHRRQQWLRWDRPNRRRRRSSSVSADMMDLRVRPPIVSGPSKARLDFIRNEAVDLFALEEDWFCREMRRRPLMISTAEPGDSRGPRRRPGRTKGWRPRTPAPPSSTQPTPEPVTFSSYHSFAFIFDNFKIAYLNEKY